MNFLCILLCFFLCILLFYDFCCLRSSFGSISSWINDIQSKKRTKLLIYRPKWKIHFAICFVHKIKKFSLFGLTFGRKRSRDSVTGGLIFANLVSKYPQDFKEKVMKQCGWKRGGFACAAKFVWGGGPPPPPPVQLGLIRTFATRTYQSNMALLQYP